jgi:nucleoside-diphosphate-sugar epimerase
MAQMTEILADIQRAAGPYQQRLSDEVRNQLTTLTAALLAAHTEGTGELTRYLSIRRRTIPLDDRLVADHLRDRVVVVTGGSGCLGTALLEQVVRHGPRRVASLAITAPARAVPGVVYEHVDVRDRADVESALRRLRPDIVFHLAAQRDPGLAERRVRWTIETNVLGTRNVVEAAEAAGARRFVFASTGKALRPYTSDVYASSKRLGEWLVAAVAARGAMACSGVRFTHVVDNSIVLDRLYRWCREREVIRLHAADTMFYAQSAKESAQLLLTALQAPGDGVFRLHTIRDLGWPIGLLDLALGVMHEQRTVSPLYIAGYDPGYEEAPYPGLYDPLLAGDVSPLVNAIEAHHVEPAASPAVDAVAVAALHDPKPAESLSTLENAMSWPGDTQLRATFDTLARDLLAATARATPRAVLDRIVRRTEVHRSGMSAEHLLIDDVLRRHAPRKSLPAPLSGSG